VNEQVTMIEGCDVAAVDWFPRVAEELELLEVGAQSWRSDAAERLRLVAADVQILTPADGETLALIALELAAEEDQAARDQGLVTWRTLAANELSALAETLRRESVRSRP
jgi:hypothetical protein